MSSPRGTDRGPVPRTVTPGNEKRQEVFKKEQVPMGQSDYSSTVSSPLCPTTNMRSITLFDLPLRFLQPLKVS